MGGGTVLNRVLRPKGRAPAFNLRAGLLIFEALRWVDPLASTRGPTSDLPRSATPPTRLLLRERTRARPAQFDGKPFNKGSMAASVIATVAGGAGVICFAAFFQNKKHGFIK